MSWIGLHTCGSTIEAVADGSGNIYRCQQHKSTIDESECIILRDEDLPSNIEPSVVQMFSREQRRYIAQQDSKQDAINTVVKYYNQNRSSFF